MRRRRRKSHPPGGHERWLVSYADFITLLFAFFTTLYAISVVDAHKAERLVRSIRESFGEQAPGLGSDEPGIFEPLVEPLRLGDTRADAERQAAAQRMEILGQRARRMEGAGSPEQGIRVRQTEEGLVISLADSLFFLGAGSDLSPAMGEVVPELARLLAEVPNHVRVEGHTDDRPIATQAFPSNWHLSAARAVSIVRALEAAGIPSYRLSASGFAAERPLVSNETPEGRQMNRRVDIVILRALPPTSDD